MSVPMTAGERVKIFARWGVQIKSYPGWDTHTRPGEWGPVHGVMVHHTGDDAPDKVDFRVLWEGREDLKGPLCHWGMADNGIAHMVGNGRASHAGIGSGRVLASVIREHYRINPPLPTEDDTDGNPHFYGQETMYSGARRMTDEAYNATVLVCAGVCEFHGWTSKSVIGHKEWTNRKNDPGHLAMAELRYDVSHALNLGPTRSRKTNFRNP